MKPLGGCGMIQKDIWKTGVGDEGKSTGGGGGGRVCVGLHRLGKQAGLGSI